jgi:alpha-ribazole phosphatase/probable phosphoglycerate mutase
LIIIDLIRHVKVAGEPALYGKTDVLPLLDENQQLLSQLTNRASYDVIISSPKQRCRLLAQLLAKAMNKPLMLLKPLQEIDFGLYDGFPFDKISRKNKVGLDSEVVNWPLLEAFFQAPADVHLPEAESLVDFNQRVSTAWNNLLAQQYQSLCGDGTQVAGLTELDQSIKRKVKRIAIITHGGVIRMILANILAVDWTGPHWYQNLNIAYGSLTTVTVTQPFQHERLLQQVSNIAMPLLD